MGAPGLAQPGRGPALASHVGRGFAEPPPHKLQPATCERSSGRGVDELRGFKLVLGSWRKKQNKTRAETWQGTGLQPQRPGETTATAPSPRGHSAVSAGGQGLQEEEGTPGQPQRQYRGGDGRQPLAPPHSPSQRALLVCQSCKASLHPHLGNGLGAPSTEVEGLEATLAPPAAAVPGGTQLPACPFCRHRGHAKGQKACVALVCVVTTAPSPENKFHSIQASSSLFMSHLRSLHLQNFLNNLCMVYKGGRGTCSAENQVTPNTSQAAKGGSRNMHRYSLGKKTNPVFIHIQTPEVPSASEDI